MAAPDSAEDQVVVVVMRAWKQSGHVIVRVAAREISGSGSAGDLNTFDVSSPDCRAAQVEPSDTAAGENDHATTAAGTKRSVVSGIEAALALARDALAILEV